MDFSDVLPPEDVLPLAIDEASRSSLLIFLPSMCTVASLLTQKYTQKYTPRGVQDQTPENTIQNQVMSYMWPHYPSQLARKHHPQTNPHNITQISKIKKSPSVNEVTKNGIFVSGPHNKFSCICLMSPMPIDADAIHRSFTCDLCSSSHQGGRGSSVPHYLSQLARKHHPQTNPNNITQISKKKKIA